MGCARGSWPPCSRHRPSSLIRGWTAGRPFDPRRSTLLGKFGDERIGVSERDNLRVFDPGAVLQTGAVADRSAEGRDAILQSGSLDVPRQGCALVKPFHRAEA